MNMEINVNYGRKCYACFFIRKEECKKGGGFD